MKNQLQKHIGLKYQAGISNIQIMVGVLVGAIMISGGMGMLRTIDQAKADNDLQDLTDYKKKAVALALQHGGNFNGVTQDELVTNNFFAQTDVTKSAPGSVVSNRWGGVVTASMSGIYVWGDAIRLDYSGVPSRACKLLGMAAGATADAVMVNGAWVKLQPAAGGTGYAVEPTLVSLCDNGGGNSTVSYFLTKN